LEGVEKNGKYEPGQAEVTHEPCWRCSKEGMIELAMALTTRKRTARQLSERDIIIRVRMRRQVGRVSYVVFSLNV